MVINSIIYPCYSLRTPRPLGYGALSDDARLTSVAYIGPKSRTERPRKTKFGIDGGHVTWLRHHFQGQ